MVAILSKPVSRALLRKTFNSQSRDSALNVGKPVDGSSLTDLWVILSPCGGERAHPELVESLTTHEEVVCVQDRVTASGIPRKNNARIFSTNPRSRLVNEARRSDASQILHEPPRPGIDTICSRIETPTSRRSDRPSLSPLYLTALGGGSYVYESLLAYEPLRNHRFIPSLIPRKPEGISQPEYCRIQKKKSLGLGTVTAEAVNGTQGSSIFECTKLRHLGRAIISQTTTSSLEIHVARFSSKSCTSQKMMH